MTPDRYPFARSADLAIAGMIACLALLGLLLFLPEPAPPRHGSVGPLFVGPKIGLRVAMPGRAEEARR